MTLMKRFDGIAWRQIAAILWRRITSDISTRPALRESRISWKRPNGTRAPPYPGTPRLNTISGFVISVAGGGRRVPRRARIGSDGQQMQIVLRRWWRWAIFIQPPKEFFRYLPHPLTAPRKPQST